MTLSNSFEGEVSRSPRRTSVARNEKVTIEDGIVSTQQNSARKMEDRHRRHQLKIDLLARGGPFWNLPKEI